MWLTAPLRHSIYIYVWLIEPVAHIPRTPVLPLSVCYSNLCQESKRSATLSMPDRGSSPAQVTPLTWQECVQHSSSTPAHKEKEKKEPLVCSLRNGLLHLPRAHTHAETSVCTVYMFVQPKDFFFFYMTLLFTEDEWE